VPQCMYMSFVLTPSFKSAEFLVCFSFFFFLFGVIRPYVSSGCLRIDSDEYNIERTSLIKCNILACKIS